MNRTNRSPKHWFVSSLVIASACISSIAVAEEAKQVCKDVTYDQVYLHTTIRIDPEESIGEAYKNKIEQIEAFGIKHNIAHFKITSQDMSVSNGCCGSYQPEVSVAVAIEMTPSYSIIDTIREELKVPSFSSSRVSYQHCEAVKEKEEDQA